MIYVISEGEQLRPGLSLVRGDRGLLSVVLVLTVPALCKREHLVDFGRRIVVGRKHYWWSCWWARGRGSGMTRGSLVVT